MVEILILAHVDLRDFFRYIYVENLGFIWECIKDEKTKHVSFNAYFFPNWGIFLLIHWSYLEIDVA